MNSEPAAFQAAQQRHHRYMIFGKKQRYIEVFQCSGEDMNMVLTGSALPTATAAAAATQPKTPAMLPPGMLPAPQLQSALTPAVTGLEMPPAVSSQTQSPHNNPLLLATQNLATLGQNANQFAQFDPSKRAQQQPLLDINSAAAAGLIPIPCSTATGYPPQFMAAAPGLQQFFLPQMLRLGVPGASPQATALPPGLAANHSLLQSQLAAQRFLLQQSGAIPGLAQPRWPAVSQPQLANFGFAPQTSPLGGGGSKRSFEQAFSAGATTSPKRPAPTISANPTTYPQANGSPAPQAAIFPAIQ